MNNWNNESVEVVILRSKIIKGQWNGYGTAELEGHGSVGMTMS